MVAGPSPRKIATAPTAGTGDVADERGRTSAPPRHEHMIRLGCFCRSARCPFQSPCQALARELQHDNVMPLPTEQAFGFCGKGLIALTEVRKAEPSELGDAEVWLVEPRGFEPLTSSLRTRRSPN